MSKVSQLSFLEIQKIDELIAWKLLKDLKFA